MTTQRVWIMVLAPAPIVIGSLAVSHWLRPTALAEPASNTVLLAEAPTEPVPARFRQPEPRPIDRERLEVRCGAAGDKLATQLGTSGHVVVRAPFVVAGNLSEAQLLQWYEQTIAPAARAMAHAYFDTPPDAPMTVLLFSDESSYNHFARELFGDEGVSIFGYYKPALRTLVMNIDTGGGTLVHELTHALMAFDFPGVPDWFNEGLASLHEQCRFLPEDAGLEGLVNWRLPLLQKAIADGRLRSIEALTQGDDFRGPLEGVNYAQARYVCMYLQERELLAEFYLRFREARRRDPRGTATLAQVLGNRPWPEIDADFQKWVAALPVP